MGDLVPVSVATERRAGLLLHPTSLAGRDGIGDLGASVEGFLDWLVEAGFGVWQILPLSLPGSDQCPYVSAASLALNPLLIDLPTLVADGLLRADELPPPTPPTATIDWAQVIATKRPLLERAASRLAEDERQLDAFFSQQPWAVQTAEFLALKQTLDGAPWWQWPRPLATREPEALATWRDAHEGTIRRVAATALIIERQWARVRQLARQRAIQIVGDVPIYVDRDSADVWANRSLFQLRPDGSPRVVAGVPPDYFSETGQLWGNPLYDWEQLAATNYTWWVDRMERTLQLCDRVRIDHFRAFAAYWEVPAEAPDARTGRWVRGPGVAFFTALRAALGELPLLAEDLGDVDKAVHALRDEVGLPGMRVLQFGFDGDYANLHHPRNCPENSYCYTGTHDNDTILGWWTSLDEATRHRVRVDLSSNGEQIVFELIKACFATPSRVAIVPMQDLLGLGSDARMNRPGVVEGNWRWKMHDDELTPTLAATVRSALVSTGRR